MSTASKGKSVEEAKTNGKVEVRVDQERLGSLVTVDEWCDLEDGRVKAMRSVLGKFVVGSDGEYLSVEDGMRVIGKLTINELNATANTFRKVATESAVPPENGAA